MFYKLKTLKRERKVHPLIRDLLGSFPLVVLAGGAVRDALVNAPISDYDLFLLEGQDALTLREYIEKEGGVQTFACPVGKLFTYDYHKMKVQIINQAQYENVEALLNTFDFTACCFALHNGTTYISKAGMKSARKKVLRLHALTYPSSTINRLYKYRKRGYYVGDCIPEIVQAINTMDYDPKNDYLYVD